MSAKLILASSSPRRRQLLAETGRQFEVIDPPIAEPADCGGDLSPAQQAEALAYFKASSVARLHPGQCVLGADTIVAVGGKILGKPADSDRAREMLRLLSSTRHEVITGVAMVMYPDRRLIASDRTYVTMREMSADEIEHYIASGEWIGKAGGYAIQETGDRFIDRVDGSFSNVVGLPMELTARMLAEVIF